MQIEKVLIDSITEYEFNAKEHPRDQIEQIKTSITEYGNNDPIAIDENNEIIEGHGRYIALKELGYKEVEVIRLSHLTDEQKRAYRLIHNKLTMNSDFDFEALEKELAELTAFDFDMSAFGFDESVFDNDTFGTDFELPDDEKGEYCQMTFTLHNGQAEVIKSALSTVGECSETFGNSNKNGNALYEVVKQWAEQKNLY